MMHFGLVFLQLPGFLNLIKFGSFLMTFFLEKRWETYHNHQY